MRRKVIGGVIGAVCAGMVGVGGWGAYNVVQAVTGGGSAAQGPAAATAAPTGQSAQHFVQAFLDSWAAGHYQGAASDTDDPSDAAQQLQAYHDGLKLTSVAFGAVRAVGTHVTFHVTDQLAGHGSWSYDSAADVVEQNGQLAVHWVPAVLYPKLTQGQQLAVTAIPAAAAARVTDSQGRPLSGDQYPSLTGIISDLLSGNAGRVQGGSPGEGIAVTDSSGDYLSTVRPFTSTRPATLRTTLDAGLQAAAERAVHDGHLGGKPASVVAIDPTTGWIRAVAFTGGFDSALSGATAPGSTMKMITAAALLDKGGLTPAGSAPCTPTVEVNGQIFHNVDNEHASGADMATDFAMSCNTAFIRLAYHHLGHGDLHAEAQDVFGLRSWSIGVASADPSVPDPGDSPNDFAAEAIGQGSVAMSPLAMASVTATVADGTFRQPILLPGLPQTPASRPLAAGTAGAVRSMMRATAAHGTAAPRMTGISGGAKTGTAEVGSGTNGWFAAYDGRIAVAAMVQGGSTGVDSAGYVARDLLLTE